MCSVCAKTIARPGVHEPRRPGHTPSARAALTLALTCRALWPVKVSTNPDEEVTGWLEGLLPDEGEEASSLYHQYIVSFYFINTIFSTVGFGAPPCLLCACVCVCVCACVRVRV